ncbi:transglycosylase SLT domain-containing protein [Candidatus Woesearchaeota archaeon]|nr:transglycosylase SLT domain-containing protein [Candidatus Woesearchaeota archaeon]
MTGRGIAATGRGMKRLGSGLMTTIAVGGSAGGSAISGTARFMSGVNVLLFVTIVVHLIDVITGYQAFAVRFFLYFVLTIYAWLVVFNRGAATLDFGAAKLPLALSLWMFLIPYAASFPWLNIITGTETFIFLVTFIPAWPLFLMLTGGTRTTKIALILYITAWLVIGFPTIMTTLGNDLGLAKAIIPVDTFKTIYQGYDRFTKGLGVIGKNLWDLPVNIFRGVIRAASGEYYDYYTGSVDKNVQEPLGVYIEKVKAADPKYYENDVVVIYGLLKARTLDTTIPIKISYSCYEEDGENKKLFTARPGTTFNVESFDTIDLECNAHNLPVGGHTIKLAAEFEDFPTYGYAKVYFMDRERLRSLEKEGIDPFKFGGITDKNPEAKYTNGPVMLGMGTAGEITGISNAQTVPPRVGITIDNRWKGEVIEIKELFIQVPEQVTIPAKDSCGPRYEVTEVPNKEFSPETENDPNYKLTYKLKRISPGGKEEAKTPHTIFCNLRITDVKDFLGSTPVAIKYFRAKVNYRYKITDHASVTITKLSKGFIPSQGIVAVGSAYLPEKLSEDYNERKLQIIEAVKKYAVENQVPVSLALAVIDIESEFRHCCKDTSKRAGNDPNKCEPTNEKYCPGKTLKSDLNPPSIGVMQINSANSPIGCNSLEDIECNIKTGISMLRQGYILYKNGCRKAANYESIKAACENCKTGQGNFYHEYREWDAALRAYNGWGCPSTYLEAVNYVGSVNSRIAQYKQYEASS